MSDRLTAREAAHIAEACRAYLAAHENRNPNYPSMTLRETTAAYELRDTLVASVGQPVAA